jgi:lysyl-tRNA synthetase class II
LKISEASLGEAGTHIKKLLIETAMEVVAGMNTARPTDPPGLENEKAWRDFDVAWKRCSEELKYGINICLRRLNAELNNPTIELGRWEHAKYKDLVCSVAGVDWFEVTIQERRRRAIEVLGLGGDIAAGYEDFEVTGAVFEKLVEPTLIQPTFVTHLPKELVPLAKLSPDDPTTVEVFECCINGQEISPGYTEQNDPIQQRQTLEHQAGGEQQKLDEDFLVALEHGMPPAGGIGIGIDRLCMMLLGQESIRDVILFPQLKPK